MKVHTGSLPLIEGRYVVFCRCESRQVSEWVEPVIATWHGERWHLPADFMRGVLGWAGPIPPMKAAELTGEKTWDEVFADLRKTEHGSYVADGHRFDSTDSTPPVQEYDL